MFIISPITSGSIPKTGLSPTIKIRRVDNGSVVVSDENMEEIGDGYYKYEFKNYSGTISYAIKIDGTSNVPTSERYQFATNENFIKDIWQAPVDCYPSTAICSGSVLPVSTSSGMLNFVHDINVGRWKIDVNTKQMIFYREDGITEVAKFNLYDKNGVPAFQNVFERKRQ